MDEVVLFHDSAVYIVTQFLTQNPTQRDKNVLVSICLGAQSSVWLVIFIQYYFFFHGLIIGSNEIYHPQK